MIRLYVAEDLAPGADIALGSEPSHYLTNVMRQAVGARLCLFNGRDGEWTASLAEST